MSCKVIETLSSQVEFFPKYTISLKANNVLYLNLVLQLRKVEILILLREAKQVYRVKLAAL